MTKNKQILSYCPNFHKIINFEYFENDVITEHLITIYENFIFSADVSNKEELKKISDIDTVLSKYIDDYIFRKEMKYELLQIKLRKDQANILDTIVLSIIKIYENFMEGDTKTIYISKWI